jgi:glycogen(starch) synthase
MRLLFVSNFYPPHDLGGMEQLCQEVAIRLERRGHSVTVLTSLHGTRREARDVNGVIRSLHLQANVNHYRPTDFFLKRPAQERDNARTLRMAIDGFSPHLVMVWGMWNLSRNLPYWAEQWMPARVAYYVASTWPINLDIHEAYWRLPAGRQLSEWIKRPVRALALAQLQQEGYPPRLRFGHSACCSHYIRDILVEAGRLPSSASVIHNGIDPQPFLRDLSNDIQVHKGPLRLLYFGMLVDQKGVHTAIEAMGLLKQWGLAERVELTILGSGHPDYEAQLREMVAQLNLGRQVRFVGRVPRDQVPSWLGRSDVFLFTSKGPEAMARTVMEAMASGLLVIGTRVGGQKEMLFNRKNGLTFPTEDAAALADRIRLVIGDPALRQDLAQAGQQMVLERFTLERMVDHIEAWLASISP